MLLAAWTTSQCFWLILRIERGNRCGGRKEIRRPLQNCQAYRKRWDGKRLSGTRSDSGSASSHKSVAILISVTTRTLYVVSSVKLFSATQLIHPNIVGVYDVDEEDELQYIVMEFIDGTDLKKYIDIQGRVLPEKAIHIMHQVLSAVALAHKNRIIHRDIKPQNILIDNQDRIKITDFGIAVALSETSITQTNTLLGSVHYLSSEQARGSMALPNRTYTLWAWCCMNCSADQSLSMESRLSVSL